MVLCACTWCGIFPLVVRLYCYLFSLNWEWFPHKNLSMLQYFCVGPTHLVFSRFVCCFSLAFSAFRLQFILIIGISSTFLAHHSFRYLFLFMNISLHISAVAGKATPTMHFKWCEKVKKAFLCTNVSVGVQVLLDRKYFSRSIAIRKNTYYRNCVRVYSTLMHT